MRRSHALLIAALAAVPAFLPAPARAWWHRRPVVVVPAPVYGPGFYGPRFYGPRVYGYPPPVVVGPRYRPHWVPGHWNGWGAWVPPHWR